MKAKIKTFLAQHTPNSLGLFQAINNRRIFRSRFGALHKEVRTALYGKSEIVVLSGVFKGLKYFDEIVWGPITPKWLGSYEVELASIIEQIVANKYDVVIDVGCAEGYYATGLAYRMPFAQVYAYDTDFISRRQTRRLAKLNSVNDRVHVASFCSNFEIHRRANGKSLMICDIEGFERELLDPAGCPALCSLDILVEIHEDAPNINTLNLLKDRFLTTHTITELESHPRIEWVEAELKTGNIQGLSKYALEKAANEHRPSSQKWLWLKRN